MLQAFFKTATFESKFLHDGGQKKPKKGHLLFDWPLNAQEEITFHVVFLVIPYFTARDANN